MVLNEADLSLADVRWSPSYRVIPTRYPPIQLFEEVADPDQLDDVFLIESLTNTRLRDEVGDLSLVPPGERVSGRGTSFIMSAFTHLSPGRGGRFSDSTFGSYYAAADLRTAVEETVYHRERFLRESREPLMRLDMRVIRSTLKAPLHDLRGMKEKSPEIYDPGDYTHSQALARKLRAASSWGVVYDSVRHAAGECAAVFRPRALSPAKLAEHLEYVWDGERIHDVFYRRRIIR
jgi:hypothetical protein